MKISKKSILIITLVIVTGLMSGVILSESFPQKYMAEKEDSSSSNNNQPAGQITNQNSAEMELEISPNPLRPYDETLDYKEEWDKVDKAYLTVSYTNTSASDLTDLQVWMTSPSQILLSGTETAEQDNEMTSQSGKIVYNIPDVSAGGSNNARIILFSSTPGQYNITADLRTTDGKIISSKPISLTVR